VHKSNLQGVLACTPNSFYFLVSIAARYGDAAISGGASTAKTRVGLLDMCRLPVDDVRFPSGNSTTPLHISKQTTFGKLW